MHWVDEPVVSPYLCGLCGNGAENKNCRPFFQTDFLYSEGGADLRLHICKLCLTAIALADDSPVAKDIKRGRKALVPVKQLEPFAPIAPHDWVTTTVVPAVSADEIADKVVKRLADHERMAKARAARKVPDADAE